MFNCILLFTFADYAEGRECKHLTKDEIGDCNGKNPENPKACPLGTKANPRKFPWIIQYQNADGKDGRPEPPDGFERYVYTINGITPGPTIIVNKGDWVLIPVTNNIIKSDKSKESTTIHWHGISMRGVERQEPSQETELPGTPFMDGVPGINQCPIEYGKKFDYLFQCVDSGTFWYHSHQGVQLADGLVGSLIVKDCNDSKEFDYNEDDDWVANIVNVQDWYHDPAEDILKDYMKINDPKDFTITESNKAVPKEAIPFGGLVGGTMFNDCAKTCINGITTEDNCRCRKYKEYKFSKDRPYRLRLISMAAMSMAFFSIDDHKFEIIEVDGMMVKRTEKKPDPWQQIPINTGQRYSIIIDPRNKTLDSYWMRFKFPSCSYRNGLGDQKNPIETKAIIRYVDDDKVPDVDPDTPEADPVTHDEDPLCKSCVCTDFGVSELMPYCDEKKYNRFCTYDHKLKVKYNFTMELLMDAFGEHSPLYHKGEWEQNFYGYIADKAHGIAPYDEHRYSHSSSNTFLEVLKLSDPKNHFSEWESSRNAYNLKDRNSIVDLLIKNSDTMEHPIHLHGHFFYVLGWGKENTKYYDGKYSNIENPIQRDTATVPKQGWLNIRFTVDNPGVWPMHCHIDWHIAIGMLAQFVEMPRDAINTFIKDENKAPYEWCEACEDATKYCAAKK